MNGSHDSSRGTTRATAIVPIPLSASSSSATKLIRLTCLNHLSRPGPRAAPPSASVQAVAESDPRTSANSSGVSRGALPGQARLDRPHPAQRDRLPGPARHPYPPWRQDRATAVAVWRCCSTRFGSATATSRLRWQATGRAGLTSSSPSPVQRALSLSTRDPPPPLPSRYESGGPRRPQAPSVSRGSRPCRHQVRGSCQRNRRNARRRQSSSCWRCRSRQGVSAGPGSARIPRSSEAPVPAAAAPLAARPRCVATTCAPPTLGATQRPVQPRRRRPVPRPARCSPRPRPDHGPRPATARRP